MQEVPAERAGTPRPLEVDLVVSARSGDRDAFDRLMAGRVEPAFRTAMAILGHEADARDATQEVFVKAWRELRSLRGRYRSQAREIPATALVGAQDPPASRGEDRFEEHAADVDLLERAFERLAADERALLVLHHLDRRPVAAIAAILDIPEGTAKSRLYAARRALERAIEVEQR